VSESTGNSEEQAWQDLQCYTLALGDSEFIHQHVVDAWTARQANSSTKPIALTFALIGLYLHVEKGHSGRQVQEVHMQLAQKKRLWPSFTLPEEQGAMTAVEVMSAPPGTERNRAIDAWCASVWEAFGDCREQVAGLLQQHGVF